MGLGRYAAEMCVKLELKEILDWLDDNYDFIADPPILEIRNEIQRRYDEPTEG